MKQKEFYDLEDFEEKLFQLAASEPIPSSHKGVAMIRLACIIAIEDGVPLENIQEMVSKMYEYENRGIMLGEEPC